MPVRRGGLHLAATHCYYCPRHFDNSTRDGRKTRDHKQPSSRGGTDALDNLVACCAKCNQEKGNMTEAEFRHWLALGRPNRKGYLVLLGLAPVKPGTKGYARAIRRNCNAILDWLESRGAPVDRTWVERKPRPE